MLLSISCSSYGNEKVKSKIEECGYCVTVNLTEMLKEYINKKLVLWGMTEFAQEILVLFRKYNIAVVGICDNNNTKWDTIFEGVPVISPIMLEELYFHDDDVLVLITNISVISCNSISAQLDAMGISRWVIALHTGLEFYSVPINLLESLTAETLDFTKLELRFIQVTLS